MGNLVTFAHITADTITALGNPPNLEWDGTRWWDIRDPEIRTARGWFAVTETPRPAPIEGGVHESTVELVDGMPVRVWTWRPWTADELAAKAEQAAYDAQRATVKAIITDLQAEKARAQSVIDTPNATINASPAPHIKDVARAAKRIAGAAIDLARYVAP